MSGMDAKAGELDVGAAVALMCKMRGPGSAKAQMRRRSSGGSRGNRSKLSMWAISALCDE